MPHRGRALFASILVLVAVGVAAALPARAQTASPSPSPTPSASPSPSPASSPSPSPSEAEPSPPPATEPPPTPVAPVVAPAVTVSSTALVAQVGRTVRFTIALSNPSDEDLDGVVVVGLVPSQVKVTGLPFHDVVDAVQLGEHRGRQDIVWVLSRLRAGQAVRLTWSGQVTSAANLLATHDVEVRVSDRAVASGRAHLHLARVSVGSPSNPSVHAVTERVETVAASVETTRPGGLLPVTGAELTALGWLAFALMSWGVVLWAGGARRPRMAVSVLAVAVAVSGCVSSTEPRSTRETPRDDRVGGLRIERDQDEADEAPGADAEPDRGPGEVTDAEAEDSSDPSPVGQRTAPELVTRVVRVVLSEEDLPIVALSRSRRAPSRRVNWSEVGGLAEQPRVASGEGLTLRIVEAGRRLEATVSLTASRDLERTRLKGRFVYEIRGSRGSTKLVSSPVDAILTPGGSISARFEHRLPTGDYEVETHFLVG